VRQTEQRTLILEELNACAREGLHPGAEELHARLRKRLPRISLATVYRNLELLAGSGVIGRVDGGGGHRRFDGVREPHCHFHCTACGRVEDLPFAVQLPPLDSGHPWVRARRVQGGRPEYFGLWPACAKLPRAREPRTPRGNPGRGTP